MHNIRADYIFHFGLNMGADYTYYDDKSTYVLINTPENSTSETEKIKSLSEQTIGKTFMYANQTHLVYEQPSNQLWSQLLVGRNNQSFRSHSQ